jgi:pyridoxine/pyridoxamine 5'-phosphate oxidase
MFSFLPENRILETRFATYDIMTPQGWGSFQIPYQVITGWKRPTIKEIK